MVHNEEAVPDPLIVYTTQNWPQSSWRMFIIGKESEWVMKLSHKWYQGITVTLRTPVSGRVSSPKYAASSLVLTPNLFCFLGVTTDRAPWKTEELSHCKSIRSNFDTHLKTAEYASVASLIWKATLQYGPVYGEILGKIGWDPSGFQVQPVTCWYLLNFLYWFKVYFIDSSKLVVICLKSWK